MQKFPRVYVVNNGTRILMYLTPVAYSSLLVAEKAGTDPTPVETIERFKQSLGKGSP